MTTTALATSLEAIVDRRPQQLTALTGASTGTVMRADFADSTRLVVKTGADNLALERRMLADLARDSDVPLPGVVYGDDAILVLEFLDHDPGIPGPAAQRHAGHLLAGLHQVIRPAIGYPYDTVIGKLHQPNPTSERWLTFFAEQRLGHMVREGVREGTVSHELATRLDRLAGRLDRYLDEPDHPSLLHGDLWTGNLLHKGDRIVGLIDPAIYWGHPEIELAYMTLFDTVTEDFFAAYCALRPIDEGFFELRRDIYNIYPLLVHVRYWDAAYSRPIDATLRRLGL
ncbi:MAG: fructosamine kinase family protein [Pseudomonadota bacterium]